jgi:hypothetical protein
MLVYDLLSKEKKAKDFTEYRRSVAAAASANLFKSNAYNSFTGAKS